jgi:hypothetical protein
MSRSSFVTVTHDVVIVVLSQGDPYHASLAQKLRSSIQQQAHEADQVGACGTLKPYKVFYSVMSEMLDLSLRDQGHVNVLSGPSDCMPCRWKSVKQ